MAKLNFQTITVSQTTHLTLTLIKSLFINYRIILKAFSCENAFCIINLIHGKYIIAV